MAKWVIFEHSSGGQIESTHTSYNTARAGANLVATDSTLIKLGHEYNGSAYDFAEAFTRYETSSVTGQLVSAYLKIYTDGPTATPSKISRVQVRRHDWGTSLTTADFVAGANLASKELVGDANCADVEGATLFELRSWNGAAERFVVVSSKQVDGTSPGTSGSGGQLRIDTGVSNSVVIEAYTIPLSAHRYTGDSLFELSDGTWISARAVPGTGNLVRVYHSPDGAAWTQIGGDQDVSAWPQGRQAVALTRDDDDNLYLAGWGPGGARHLRCKAFVKGAGYAWTERNFIYAQYDDYEAISHKGTAIAANWVNTGGGLNAKGHVYITHSSPRVGVVDEVGVFSLGDNEKASVVMRPRAFDAGELLDNTSSSVVAAGPSASPSGYIFDDQYNEMPRGTDLSALVDGDKLVIAFANAGRVRIQTTSSGGRSTELSSTFSPGDQGTGEQAHRSVKANVGYIRVSGRPDNSVSMSLASTSDLSGINGASTSVAGVGNTGKWDVVYDSIRERVWLYYIPDAAPTELRRYYYSLNSGIWASSSPVVLTTTAIPAGATPHGVRTVIHPSSYGFTLVEIAYTDSGGAEQVATFMDNLSTPPQAPTLGSFPNYDAANPATLTWEFNDADPGDSQSAYEVEVVNASSGTSVVDTGKVASTVSSHTIAGATLTNGNAYQVRVRVWDSHDAVGEFSNWLQFRTSSTPVAAITSTYDPVSGNDAYDVTWSYTQAESVSQAYYRVTNVANGASVVDTGWVASTATTYTVDLVSDVLNEVSVQVESAFGLRSAIVTESFTPDFRQPMVPTVAVSTVPYGRKLAITNPAPVGDTVETLFNQVWRSQPGDPSLRQGEAVLLGTSTRGEEWVTKAGRQYRLLADQVAASVRSAVVLNTNGGFESGTTGWDSVGGTLDQSSAQVRSGTFSGLLTPDGVTAVVSAGMTVAAAVAVTEGEIYTGSVWAYSELGYASGNVLLEWRDAGGALLNSTPGATGALASETFTQFSYGEAAPVGAAQLTVRFELSGTPAATDEVYLDDLEVTGPDEVNTPTEVVDVDLYPGEDAHYFVRAVS